MNQHYSSQHTERHLHLWIYLLPIVGVVPAIWTLYRHSSKNSYQQDDVYGNAAANRDQEKVSRQAISLLLLWLCSYTLLSWGSTNGSEILSFRLLYLNTVLTSAYFVTCTYLMTRLNKKTLCNVKEENELSID